MMSKYNTIHYWQERGRKSIHDWHYYKPYLANCIKYGSPGKILDIGAGMGGFVECCRRFGLNCIGLEGDKHAVSEARRRYEMDIKHYRISKDNPLPFPNEEFGIVFCNHVIEHLVPDDAKFLLKECYRILKVGGALFIYSPCYFNKKARSVKEHINLYTPTRLQREALEVGFKVIIPMDYPQGLLSEPLTKKIFVAVVFALIPCDRLSNSANLIAQKTANGKKKIFGPRYFHIRRITHW